MCVICASDHFEITTFTQQQPNENAFWLFCRMKTNAARARGNNKNNILITRKAAMCVCVAY